MNSIDFIGINDECDLYSQCSNDASIICGYPDFSGSPAVTTASVSSTTSSRPPTPVPYRGTFVVVVGAYFEILTFCLVHISIVVELYGDVATLNLTIFNNAFVLTLKTSTIDIRIFLLSVLPRFLISHSPFPVSLSSLNL